MFAVSCCHCIILPMQWNGLKKKVLANFYQNTPNCTQGRVLGLKGRSRVFLRWWLCENNSGGSDLPRVNLQNLAGIIDVQMRVLTGVKYQHNWGVTWRVLWLRELPAAPSPRSEFGSEWSGLISSGTVNKKHLHLSRSPHVWKHTETVGRRCLINAFVGTRWHCYLAAGLAPVWDGL